MANLAKLPIARDEKTWRSFEIPPAGAVGLVGTLLPRHYEEFAKLEAQDRELKGRTRGKNVVDPTKPKQPAGGAYGVFLAANRQAIAKHMPAGVKMTDIAKEAGKQWKASTEEVKAKYEKKYQKKKAAYQAELQTWREATGIDVESERKAKNGDADKPKRPVGGAFGVYSARQHANIALTLPSGSKGPAIQNAVGESWRQLDADVKGWYERKYQKKKHRHEEALKAWQQSKQDAVEAANKIKLTRLLQGSEQSRLSLEEDDVVTPEKAALSQRKTTRKQSPTDNVDASKKKQVNVEEQKNVRKQKLTKKPVADHIGAKADDLEKPEKKVNEDKRLTPWGDELPPMCPHTLTLSNFASVCDECDSSLPRGEGAFGCPACGYQQCRTCHKAKDALSCRKRANQETPQAESGFKKARRAIMAA